MRALRRAATAVALLALAIGLALWLVRPRRRAATALGRPLTAPSSAAAPPAGASRTPPPVASALPAEARVRARDAAAPPPPVCTSDGDCAAPAACVFDAVAGRARCMASECARDADCPRGARCLAANDRGGGRPVRACAPSGQRVEGEPCSEAWPFTAGRLCRDGLVCVVDYCGPPCAPDAGCADGRECVVTPQGTGCFPSCLRAGCPPGLACVKLTDRMSLCAKQVGESCGEHPCPAGEQCLFTIASARVTWECLKPCDPLDPRSCPPDSVCGASGRSDLLRTGSACYRACDPRKVDPCPDGFTCQPVEPDGSAWGCRPVPADE